MSSLWFDHTKLIECQDMDNLKAELKSLTEEMSKEFRLYTHGPKVIRSYQILNMIEEHNKNLRLSMLIPLNEE